MTYSADVCRCEAPRGAPEAGAAPIFLAKNGFIGDSIVDGPGLRCVVFVQGCPHRCPGCQNPETWPFESGEPVGAGALLEKVKSFPMCRGVTLSGGEPFAQAAALLPLALRLKAEGYELAAYTGYTFERLMESGSPAERALLARLDTLVDGPFILAQRDLSLRFRGSANQRILDVQKCLAGTVTEGWLGE